MSNSPPPIPQSSSSAPILLSEQIEIFPDLPIPTYDTVGGKAFTAGIRGTGRQDMLAIITPLASLPRIEVVNSIRTINNPSILRLREDGVVPWGPNNIGHYALVYDLPAFSQCIQTAENLIPPIPEHALQQHFIFPLITALGDLKRAGVFHGSISPSHIMWEIGSTTPPLLGECLSSPAGFTQPTTYETIERGMCPPIGRGQGQHSDDCYAFGMTIAVMILGCDPFEKMDDATIVRLKLEKGSLAALLENQHISLDYLELLRGLLADDAGQRWRSTELEQWRNGNSIITHGIDSARTATRFFEFGGQQYNHVQPLSYALANNIPEAVKVIENGQLEKWLIHSIGDKERTKRMHDTVATLKQMVHSAFFEHQLVARVAIALYPAAPLRYRGITVMPAGIATMLADAIIHGRDTEIIINAIAMQLMTTLISQRLETRDDIITLAQQANRAHLALTKKPFVNGTERVLYELNPGLPCLSPLVINHYVTSTRQLLPVLEIIAGNPNHPREPMDAHLASFISIHDHHNDTILNVMTLPVGNIQRSIVILTIFGELQNLYSVGKLPALAKWMIPLLEPRLNEFINKSTREKMQRKLAAAAEQGNLNLLLHIISQQDGITNDMREFIKAKQFYSEIQQEISILEADLSHQERINSTISKPIIATITVAIAIVLMAFVVGLAVMRHL